ncbi:unnamed protein product [Adineta steineri]|nr:unnamed protein product [Adineta steineri]
MQLIEILFNEFIVNRPNLEEAKRDFIAFCRSSYKDTNNVAYSSQINDFESNYSTDKAVKWYTKPDSFVFRAIGETCCTFNFTNYFKIRFILHDLYSELKKLHADQSSMWPESSLVVFRGKGMPRKELSRLPKMGELFVTRGFLSFTTDHQVAEFFSGEDQGGKEQVNVIISMCIDREEVTSKPIVFVKEQSAIGNDGDEEEVILPMGIVFRVVSYEEIDNENSASLVRITMLRSKVEQEIEKKLSKFPVVASAVVTSAAVSIATLLQSLANSEYREEFRNLMADAPELVDSNVMAQIEKIWNDEPPSISASYWMYSS